MTAVHESAATAIAQRMAESALAWLDALDADQRAKASLDFDASDERTSWAYFPRASKGLSLLDMDTKQQKLAHRLLSFALSFHAYSKVTAIMSLESLVNLIEEGRLDAFRDPRRYFLAIFGTPGAERWAWRFEGHHVALNFTMLGGEVMSPTPLFLGAQPAEVRHGDAPVLRVCGEEEDAARELLLSCDADQRQLAVLCESAPPDFVLMNASLVPEICLPGEVGSLPPIQAMATAMPLEQREALRFEQANPRGLAASQMNATQRQLLSELIDVYVHRLPEPLADLERDRIERAGLDGVHFAWAGNDRPRQPHYYRVQGPSFIVEYDNTQNDVNHLHSVWRDAARDFGGDLLRNHVGRDHT